MFLFCLIVACIYVYIYIHIYVYIYIYRFLLGLGVGLGVEASGLRVWGDGLRLLEMEQPSVLKTPRAYPRGGRGG